MSNIEPSVLIVDDEQVVCDLLYDELSERGYLCAIAFDGNDALAKLATQSFDMVLLDVRLPGMSGIEVLGKMRLEHHNTATIMITAVSDVDTAVEAMKLGASDYIVKPFKMDRINTSVRTILEKEKLTGGKGNPQISFYPSGEDEGKHAVDQSHKDMDAIARGVEARFDSLLGYSKLVIEGTIEIARQFSISEKEIERWATSRAKFSCEREKAIKSSLTKLEHNPLAQVIMGIATTYKYTSNPGGFQS